MNLDVRVLSVDDVSTQYYMWFSQPDISENISWRPSSDMYEGINQLKEYVAMCLTASDKSLMGIFVDGKHVGNIKYDNINRELSACTVGILIGNPSFRGIGLAASSLRLGNSIIMRNYNTSVFELRVYSWNYRAISAYKKAGFSVVETGRLISPHPEGTIMSLQY